MIGRGEKGKGKQGGELRGRNGGGYPTDRPDFVLAR